MDDQGMVGDLDGFDANTRRKSENRGEIDTTDLQITLLIGTTGILPQQILFISQQAHRKCPRAVI